MAGGFESSAARLARRPPGQRCCSVNMASQDDELDFKSDRFNPARALSSPDVQLPDPEAKEYDDLYSLRDTVHSQNFNVVRELPGVSVSLAGLEADHHRPTESCLWDFV